MPGSKSSGNDSCELRNLKVFLLFKYFYGARVPDPGSMELFLRKGPIVYTISIKVFLKPQKIEDH